MSISSVNDSSWLYEIYYRNNFSDTQASSAQFTSGIASSDESTTLDSDAAQSLFSGVMSQGVLPVSTGSESAAEESSVQTQLDDSGEDAMSGLMAMVMMPPAPPMTMTAETATENEDTVSGTTATNQDTMSRMMPPPPPNGMESLSGSSEDTEDSTNSTSLSQQVLNMAVQSYENTGTAWDNVSWSS